MIKAKSSASRASPFDLSGGALCLDLANTTRHTPPAREDLKSYADLVAWSREAALLTETDARRIQREAAKRPEEAERALARARALREPIYRTFSAIAAGRKPTSADLAAINHAAVVAWRNSQIAARDGGYAWMLVHGSETPAFDYTLWAVARSAADLLTSSDLALVRECFLESCSWLFLDRSKNRRRRWCDMKVCGNRSKARRHYERKRRASEK